jgi:hypothetical protein
MGACPVGQRPSEVARRLGGVPEKQSLLDIVRRLYREGGRDRIWKWAMDRPGPAGKAKRFNALVRFARIERENAPNAADREMWAKLRRQYAKERDRWEAEYEEQHEEAEWPESMVLAECLYHDPPHFHLASPERDKLIQVATIGLEKFNCRIGEFPPFDTVDDVHVYGTWHGRDPAKPYVPQPFNQAKLVKGGPWGLALDANDLDGGGDQEYAFYLEVRRRYA